MNGLFNNTIILREIDDTYVSINNAIYKKVNPFNIKMFMKLYNKYSSEYNILLDYRLDILIIYGFFNFEYDILVYDPYNSIVLNVYQWFLNKFSIPCGIVSTSVIKKISYIYIIFSILISIHDIPWNVSNIIEIIKNDSNTNFLTMDVFIKYIGNQYGKSNEDNIKSLYKEIVNFIKNPITSINKFDIENLTIYDVLDTFKLLYKNNVVIQL